MYGDKNGVDYDWAGHIPLDAVTVNGASSMSVDFNTCGQDHYYSHGPFCGDIYFTVEANTPASGLIDNGSRILGDSNGYTYIRLAGSYRTRNSTSSGVIFDIPVNNSTDAQIAKGQDVEIELVIRP